MKPNLTTDHEAQITKIYSYGKQTIDQQDIDSVIEALKSDWLTQGPTVSNFEKALGNKFGSRCATVASSGTATLHLIALGLGWGKDDIVITSPITFLASANCAIYVGATPDFVDINPLSYTIDTNKLEDKLKKYSAQNKKVKAVVAVDFAGHPCDWVALKTLQARYGFQLVNDYCHSLGAEYKNDIQYAAKFADAVNLSFHPVKHITTGEGGAILSNDSEFDKRVKIFRTHGMTKDEELLSEKNNGPWYYEMHHVGFNYRLTDMQCMLGLSQLNKLEGFIEKRRKIADYYNHAFKDDTRLILPTVSEYAKHAYHLYPLQIKFDLLNVSKKEFFARLKSKRILGQVHYIPVHLQPYYKNNFGFKFGDFPIAERFYAFEISIPMYPALEEEDLNYISATIIETLNECE